MAELDFSKIFASNSPLTPYTWSDGDYLTGWNVVGQTAPARTQFDALQNLTDLKLKYLNDVKAPINSPTFTGTPKAPTPAKNDRSTRIATTAFVQQWIDDLSDRVITAWSVSQGAFYVKFNNDIVIQAGYTGGLRRNSWNTVRFAVNFTDENSYVVMATNALSDPTPLSVENISGGTFAIKGVEYFQYLAFGHV